MPPARKPGRRRSLDHRKKTLLCDIVSRGATMTEAAFTVGVSLRTVQREARLDPDFDQNLRIAHADKPDPLVIMQQAARTHWRAAAWLLERTDPDNYARRPASSASPAQYNAAIGQVMEAALAAVPPELRAAVYAQMQAAADASFEAIFPGHGHWGRRHAPQAPPTPLVDYECTEQLKRPPIARRIFDIDESRLAPAPAPAAPPMPIEPAEPVSPAPKPNAPPPAAQPHHTEAIHMPPSADPRSHSVAKNTTDDKIPSRQIQPPIGNLPHCKPQVILISSTSSPPGDHPLQQFGPSLASSDPDERTAASHPADSYFLPRTTDAA